MSFGRVNASARKIVSGWSPPHLGDQPLPEAERLGVRVVDAEDADAVVDPEEARPSASSCHSARQSCSDSKSNG